MIAAILSKIAGIALPFPLNLIPGLFKRLWSVITRHPLQCALIATLIACAWLWRQDSQHIGERDAAIAAGKAQIEIFRKAQADAIALARSEKQRKEKANAIINQSVDRDYAALRSRYAAVVMRLAKANTGGTGKADLPRADTAGLPADTSASIGDIPVIEAKKMGDATAYAEQCFAWGQKVIKEGLAQ